ncbi:MAG: hypothetical protein LBK61_05570, partial [Spirochaetaceae bacterium]|nr:hypothetical protein [Spirochaetaceae bacterium]
MRALRILAASVWYLVSTAVNNRERLFLLFDIYCVRYENSIGTFQEGEVSPSLQPRCACLPLPPLRGRCPR